MDFGQILLSVLGIVVFAVIAGAVSQIMEGEFGAGCGFLLLGVLLMAVYFGAATAFNLDYIPIDLTNIGQQQAA